jgi:hypothetical protein
LPKVASGWIRRGRLCKNYSAALVFPFQALGIFGAKLDAPEADGFIADGDTAFSEKVLDISMVQVETIIKPDGIANDVWREPVTFVCIHGPILAMRAF